MYLSFQDLVAIFPETRGVRDEMKFFTVTDSSTVPQPKGVFIPLAQNSGELNEAIANGAIAAVWDKQRPVPSYTPNHFPLFLVDDIGKGTVRLLELFIEKLDGEAEKNMESTNFYFLNKKLLNINNKTYDIAGILKDLTESSHSNGTLGGK